jgi:hypothetical protein
MQNSTTGIRTVKMVGGIILAVLGILALFITGKDQQAGFLGLILPILYVVAGVLFFIWRMRTSLQPDIITGVVALVGFIFGLIAHNAGWITWIGLLVAAALVAYQVYSLRFFAAKK